ncbi:MAG: ATP-grasp domain-containing protein [Acidobacteria bacterium]|nr:ATP-grasp domain-containing protein [Acidobacteriota bacterium]
MADRPSVLLTCSGQRVDIVRAFRDALTRRGEGGRVVVSDLDPLSPSLVSADLVVELPAVDDPGYGDAVAEVVAREGIGAVLPLTDLDPVVLAQAKPQVAAAGGTVFLPAPEVAAACQDKWLCHEALGAAGLPSPPTWPTEGTDRDALPYPMMIKPRIGFAGRWIHRCDDRDELEFFLARTPVASVLQQALPGEEFSIDCLGSLEGEAIGAIPRAMYQSKGGEQIKGETLDDPQLVDLAAAVIGGLGLIGPCTIQCFREDGRILGVTDINTRFGGGFPLPLAAGGDYPFLILAMAAGEDVAPRLGTHRAGVVMTRFLSEHVLVRDGDRLRAMDGREEAMSGGV